MKTVADVARELGVSTQTIYRKLNNVEQGLTLKKGAITYITRDGLEYIKNNVQQGSTVLNRVKQGETTENAEITYLREQVKTLQEDVRKKDERYTELAERLAQITENQQKLIGMEKIQQIEERKTGLFGFLKRKIKEGAQND
jgi:transposase-like protein